MKWIVALFLVAAVIAVMRITMGVRRARQAHERGDFDELLIARLRREGTDPFKPHAVDFFLSFAAEPVAQTVLAELRQRGYEALMYATADAADFPHTVQVSRHLALTVDAIKAESDELKKLALARGGRYDGWAAARVPRGTAD
ncbi:MAG: ribonuclease E inhibitor RraB [Steroidobacteraceae bacterium]|nr:ribonuclease E inhibitor RraB [Steroidobacteraceae bacterium]MDW8259214.1 ribonuclease E inhibitor RraB [Gammaproteobacteria bacterium]